MRALSTVHGGGPFRFVLLLSGPVGSTLSETMYTAALVVLFRETGLFCSHQTLTFIGFKGQVLSGSVGFCQVIWTWWKKTKFFVPQSFLTTLFWRTHAGMKTGWWSSVLVKFCSGEVLLWWSSVLIKFCYPVHQILYITFELQTPTQSKIVFFFGFRRWDVFQTCSDEDAVNSSLLQFLLLHWNWTGSLNRVTVPGHRVQYLMRKS